MVGFTAEYAAGQITPDGTEIVEAGWFPADALPTIPAARKPFAQTYRLVQRDAWTDHK
jgi:NAD+ diphosphatase